MELAKRETMADGAATLAQRAVEWAGSIVITSAAEAAQVVDKGREFLRNRQLCEAERDAVCKPLRKQAADHSARWKPAIDLWDQAASLFKQTALAWQRADQERAIAALPAATTVAERTEAVAALTTKTVTTFKHYSARVVDEALVPRPFWRIDIDALNALARSQKEAFSVPGCVLVDEERGRY